MLFTPLVSCYNLQCYMKSETRCFESKRSCTTVLRTERDMMKFKCGVRLIDENKKTGQSKQMR